MHTSENSCKQSHITGKWRTALVVCGLAVAVFLLYAPALHYDFVSYDDPQYITRNVQVLQGLTFSGVKWAFFNFYAANWHPLTWLSHMADVQLFGLDAGYHHLVNILLHAGNTVLLFIVLRQLSGSFWRSALVALVFAIHPLHVESVAWIAERKDVLSTLFWLLTMWCYVLYVERSTTVRYVLTLTCFILGLLAKPMLVTLPFVLLMLDAWPLNRISTYQAQPLLQRLRPLLLEKVPFFLLAFGSSLITVMAQRGGGATQTLEAMPLGVRVANALVSYLAYLGKMIWPENLAVLYPHPGAPPTFTLILSASLFLGFGLMAVFSLRKRPWFTFGWFWYLGTLVPVIGLVQVGNQSMADRYTYVPSIGIFIIVVWGVAELQGRFSSRLRPVLAAASGGALLALVLIASWQVRYWSNSMTLFTHALAVTENNPVIESNIGTELVEIGQVDDGVAHCEAALRLNPNIAQAQGTLGNVAYSRGRVDEAIWRFKKVLELDPRNEVAHNNLGVILLQQNRLPESIEHFEAALRLKPGYGSAQKNLQQALARYRGGHAR